MGARELLCLSFLVVLASAEYFITAPKNLRSGYQYTFAVSFTSLQEELNFTAEIWDIHSRNESDAVRLLSNSRVIAPSEQGIAESFTIEIPRDMRTLPWNRRYALYVMGKLKSGTDFFPAPGYKSEYLDFKEKNMSIFIQTDKAMYKPGDKVMFRTFAVDPELHVLLEPMDIEVIDNNGNKIAMWTGDTSDSGLISKELQLSTQSVLGGWTIVATMSGLQERQRFKVSEYVLPKFSVEINFPRPYLLKYDDKLRILLHAKYTYGRGVAGSATVLIHPVPGAYPSNCFMTQEEADRASSYYRTYATCTVTTHTVQLDADGRAEIDVSDQDLRELVANTADLRYTSKDPADALLGLSFMVTANVTEEATDVTLSADKTVNVKHDSISISFMSMSPSSYKPAMPYRAYLQLQNPDGSTPSLDQLTTAAGEEKYMVIKVTQKCPEIYQDVPGYYPGPYYPGAPGRPQASTSTPPPSDCVTKESFANHTVPSTGILAFEITTDDVHTRISIEATFISQYDELVTTSKEVNVFETRDDVTLQVSTTLEEGVVRPGMTVTFTVNTTKEISEFYYGIMGKSNMVHMQHIKDGMNSTLHTFDVYITEKLGQLMAPTANILVWCITETEELIADSASFTVEGAMVNEVSLEFSHEEVRPGNHINLTVSAHEGSTVALLAVDQSVLLLASGNDITEAKVRSEIRQYSTASSYTDIMYNHNMWRRIRKKRSIYCPWCFPVYGNSRDVTSLFSEAQLAIFTDVYMHTASNIYSPSIYRQNRGPVGGASGATGMAGPAGQRGMAAPAAFGPSIAEMDPGSSPESRDAAVVRTDFPETWIWQQGITGPDGRLVINEEVPDTITSWIASAFAISREKGLGVSKSTSKLTVFKPFFVSLTMPYSLTRKEEFGMKTTVFNYKNTTQQVVVTLEKSTDFKVLYKKEKVFKTVSHTISIPANDAVTVVFWIVPVSLGSIPVLVKAQSFEAADALKKYILVEPEGKEQEYSESLLVQLNASHPTYSREMRVQLPHLTEGRVNGSESIKVTAIGDLMGSTMSNLDRLVRQPTGCGEQNMLGFVPNIFAVKYLESTGQDKPDLKAKAIGYMKDGYQRELTYQLTDYHNRGSYSAFGNSDGNGSTWLTAFVLRSFQQASAYIYVDPTVKLNAAKFLIGKQNDNGSFAEWGRVIHSDMMSSTGSGIGLTAYVLTALLQVEADMTDTLEVAIEKARTYLEDNLESIRDNPYLISVVTYALRLSDSMKKNVAFEMLNEKAKISGGMRYWSETEVEEEEVDSNPSQSYHNTHSVDIEMTGYALLSYMQYDTVDISTAVQITKWLLKKRNPAGGFYSTQDTVVGLNALSSFATLLYKNQVEQGLDIEIIMSNMEYMFTRITDDNIDVLQHIDVPGSIDHISINAEGTGVAVVQLNVKYHMTEVNNSPDVHLTTNTTTVNEHTLQLDVCPQWTNTNKKSGMAMLTIQSLSGCAIDTSNLQNTHGKNGLKRIDRSGRNVNLYFDQFLSDVYCISMNQYCSMEVGNMQDAVVTAYPYYQPEKQQVAFYNWASPQTVDACLVCPSCCEEDDAPREHVHDDHGRDNNIVGDGGKVANNIICPTCSAMSTLANILLITFTLLLKLI